MPPAAQISRLQVAEVIGAAVSNPAIAENKVRNLHCSRWKTPRRLASPLQNPRQTLDMCPVPAKTLQPLENPETLDAYYGGGPLHPISPHW
jgi:hypothetical protein